MEKEVNISRQPAAVRGQYEVHRRAGCRMITFEEAKKMISALAEYGDVEFCITLKGQEYMIIQYEDHCTFQRCGYNTGSEEFPYPTIDDLYEAITVDGICLKECWNRIEFMTIEDNQLDEFQYILEAYEKSEKKQAVREMRHRRAEEKRD